MKKNTKRTLAAIFASLALFSGPTQVAEASNNVATSLNSDSWDTTSNTTASASISIRATAPQSVNGLRVRVSVSTGQATNWVERMQTGNFPSGTSASTPVVRATSLTATATGQYGYRRQNTSAFVTLPSITR